MNHIFGVAESKEEEERILIQMNSQEDYFDGFVSFILQQGPTIYVLVNITLLIWLAQTIFSSNLSAIPRSIYLISPYFSVMPINAISVVNEGAKCPSSFSKIALKSFPTIEKANITHKYLFEWSDPPIELCVRRIPQNTPKAVNAACPSNLYYCNNYCVTNSSFCSITRIERVSNKSINDGNYTEFFVRDSESFRYFKNKKGRPVVGLLAAFNNKCANDFRFYDQFNTLDDYFNGAISCGEEGDIAPFYTSFDSMSTNDFLKNNHIQVKVNEGAMKETQLGAIFQISFDNNGDCQNVQAKASQTKSYLFQDPVSPVFTQSLLVISFIILISDVGWLISMFCFKGYRLEKNLIVIMLACIEIIVISYIYKNNQQLFQTENIVADISRCIEKDIAAAQHWNFGIKSANPFIMVLFISSSFLLLFLASFALDKLIFEDEVRFQKLEQKDE